MGFLFTSIRLAEQIGLGLVVNPSLNADKVSHEAGNVALEDDVVAENHILPERVRLVILADHWKKGRSLTLVRNTSPVVGSRLGLILGV